ncbi:MAG: DUF134 domain-containing protein [Clostridia bacterium]|nr:DUF134 domain-containing protein [Clostridia bacterium]
MPRPTKWRKVCYMPSNTLYGPMDRNTDAGIITMTVDEYETIRLIDMENLTQEECADAMNVARTTVQRIYTSAREKLAKFLVNGNRLKIEGGEYKLCTDAERMNGCGQCRRGRRGQGNMGQAINK